MSNFSALDLRDEEDRLTRSLAGIESRMLRLEAQDEIDMKRAFQDPSRAEDAMQAYRDEHGEQALFIALREFPDQFGAYPDDKARFDDACEARRQLPVTFHQYKELRDEADVIRQTLHNLKRERHEPNPEDDGTSPKR